MRSICVKAGIYNKQSFACQIQSSVGNFRTKDLSAYIWYSAAPQPRLSNLEVGGKSQTKAGAQGELPLEDVRREGTEWQMVDANKLEQGIGGQHDTKWSGVGKDVVPLQQFFKTDD